MGCWLWLMGKTTMQGNNGMLAVVCGQDGTMQGNNGMLAVVGYKNAMQ